MKKFNITLIFSLLTTLLFAQNIEPYKGYSFLQDIKTIYITDDITLHFISPEKIDYVDLSNNNLLGGLATETIFRLKMNDLLLKSDSVKAKVEDELAIVTIVGKSYLAQYRIIYTDSRANLTTQIEVLPSQMTAIEKSKTELSYKELNSICYKVYNNNPAFKNVKAKGLGLELLLNNIYTRGNYIFLDITFKNNTKIKYDIDQVEFFIEDKKINKQTNFQSLLFNPIYVFDKRIEFKKRFRNVYVFEKFTYPNNKVFRIKITEQNVSGRTIELFLNYSELLNADTI